MAATPGYAPPTARTAPPIAIPLSGGAKWMISAVIVSYLLYYIVGIDQGADTLEPDGGAGLGDGVGHGRRGRGRQQAVSLAPLGAYSCLGLALC